MTFTLNTTVEITAEDIYFMTEVNDMMITFEGNLICDGYMDLLFTVDGSLERVELPKRDKLAITRWLLECWTVARQQHDKFSCCATDDDSTGWRAKMYTKLGFTQEGEAMIYN